jgi:hypothetical protein
MSYINANFLSNFSQTTNNNDVMSLISSAESPPPTIPPTITAYYVILGLLVIQFGNAPSNLGTTLNYCYDTGTLLTVASGSTSGSVATITGQQPGYCVLNVPTYWAAFGNSTNTLPVSTTVYGSNLISTSSTSIPYKSGYYNLMSLLQKYTISSDVYFYYIICGNLIIQFGDTAITGTSVTVNATVSGATITPLSCLATTYFYNFLYPYYSSSCTTCYFDDNNTLQINLAPTPNVPTNNQPNQAYWVVFGLITYNAQDSVPTTTTFSNYSSSFTTVIQLNGNNLTTGIHTNVILSTIVPSNGGYYMILGNIVIQYIDTQYTYGTTSGNYPGGKYPYYYYSQMLYPTVYSVIATPYGNTTGLTWYTVSNAGDAFFIISNLNQSSKTGYNQYYVLIISSL